MRSSKNPLNKRFLRELKSDISKYFVIFALLFVAIGFVSGFIVAAESMIKTYNDSFEDYDIENGHFSTVSHANPAQIKAIEANGVKVYELFYSDTELTNDSTLRIFQTRDKINRICLMEGAFPSAEGEIAIDRMYADNNGISIGDYLTERVVEDEKEGKSWKVTGLVAFSDYSALFSGNDEIMFDSIKFGVACVIPDEFNALEDINYCYGWKYDEEPQDELEEKTVSEELMEAVNAEIELEEFVPRYINQAIQFTGDDMGGDKSMMEVFLYIIVVITAFVYAITIKDTVQKDSAAIGTLLASGFTKRELTRHYLTLPIIVTLTAAFLGNIFGYTVFKDICVDLYYGSYSLPTYTTVWSMDALIRTTLIPTLVMGLISWLVLKKNFALPLMNFFKRDLRKERNSSALKLSERIPFFSRFRLRITIQNLPNYATLFFGVFFANALLFFGLGLPSLLDNYQNSMLDGMLAEHQYILSLPREAMDEDRKTESLFKLLDYLREVETENETAEKFSAYSLETIPEGDDRKDEIMIYGISPDSKYINKEISEGEVYVSSLFADKMQLEEGDDITLKEKYEAKQYSFHISGIYEYEGGLSLFMNIDELNSTFDLPEGVFTGYFSETDITDIPEKYIGSTIDYDSLTKVSRQLMKSFGSMVFLVNGFALVLFVLLIYLLSKIIIEKNAQSISMTKILGYTDGEVSRLYLFTTTIAVLVFVIISFPLCYYIIAFLWRYFIAMRMSGWMRFSVESSVYVKMFALGVVSYLLVAIFEYIKIKRIPMDEALKNVE